MIRLRTLALVLLSACGGAASDGKSAAAPKSEAEKAREAKQAALDKLLAQQPKLPYKLESTHAYTASRECGQGPFRLEAKTLGAKYGEKYEVYACTPGDGIKGHVRLTIEDRKTETPQAFGYAFGKDDRCRATETELAHAGDAGAAASAPAKTDKPAKATAAATQAKDERLDEATNVVIANDVQCPAGTSYVQIDEYSSLMTNGSPFEAKKPIVAEFWSDEPSVLRGVIFVVRQYGIDPSVTQQQWDDLLKRSETWWKQYADFEKSNDDLFGHEDGGAPSDPPPAARAETPPPKPSVHADWVPGYYHRTGASWTWIAGFWRVPDEDVKKELTTAAPSAPPPPRNESNARAAPPAHEVVWADGHWQWDGARWVWVEGSWRLPPRPGLSWQAPRWAPRGARFVFVPGGWARP